MKPKQRKDSKERAANDEWNKLVSSQPSTIVWTNHGEPQEIDEKYGPDPYDEKYSPKEMAERELAMSLPAASRNPEHRRKVFARHGVSLQTESETISTETRGVCPNCGQWQHDTYKGYADCLNECVKRGIVAVSEGDMTPKPETNATRQAKTNVWSNAAEILVALRKAEAQRDELLARCNAESARANRLLIERNNRIEQVRELLAVLKFMGKQCRNSNEPSAVSIRLQVSEIIGRIENDIKS